jgi:zinc ribbon protein
MRCPSCGTDNAPDSRFCGGCGTRVAVSSQRVAPTQKISDDASFPQRQLERQLAPGGPGSAVPITAPGVMAPRAAPATPFLPQGVPPAQRPLAGGSAAPARPATGAPITPAPRRQAVVVEDSRGATRAGGNGPARPVQPPADRNIGPRSVDPSLSLPTAARRPWALILVVLLIDLGLAVAGVWMLTQGLRDRPGRPAPAGTPPAPSRPS